MAGLVHRKAMQLVRMNGETPHRAHDDTVAHLFEMPGRHFRQTLPRSRHRRLVHQVLQVRAGKARRPGGDAVQVDLVGQRHVPAMHLQDRLAAFQVRQFQRHVPVEAAGPQQRRIEHIGPVGGGEDDHSLVPLEAVHLGQDLVQGLLALVVTAAKPGTANPSHTVELVDEDDGRGRFLGLVKQVADPGSTDADEHLDEL